MNPIRLLYLDPVDRRRHKVSGTLTNFGFELTEAASGEQAVSLAESDDFSLLIARSILFEERLDEILARLRWQLPDAVFVVVGNTFQYYWDPVYPVASDVSKLLGEPWDPESMALKIWRTVAQRDLDGLGRPLSGWSDDSDTQLQVRILLVATFSDEVALVRSKLSGWKAHRLDVCSSLESASQRLDSQHYSVVMTVLELPDSEGINTLSKLLVSTETPIIVLGASEDENLALEVMRLGAQDYLCIPTMGEIEVLRLDRMCVARERAQSRVRVVLRAHPQPTLIVSDLGEIQWANPSAGELFDCAPEQLNGKSFGYPATGGREVQLEFAQGRTMKMERSVTEWAGKMAYLVTLCDLNLDDEAPERSDVMDSSHSAH